MKLLTSPTSPFGRKVLIVARETGLTPPLEVVHVTLAQPGNPVVPLNPLAQIPTLQLDDGTAMMDSPVIAAYVAERAGDRTIFPAGASRWPALTLQGLGDGLTESVIATNQERQRPEGARSKDVIAKHKAKIDRCLRTFEDSLAAWSSQFTIGQISVICALGYLELRLGAGWRDAHPRLAAWSNNMHKRESVAMTAPPKA